MYLPCLLRILMLPFHLLIHNFLAFSFFFCSSRLIWFWNACMFFFCVCKVILLWSLFRNVWCFDLSFSRIIGLIFKGIVKRLTRWRWSNCLGLTIFEFINQDKVSFFSAWISPNFSHFPHQVDCACFPSISC